MLTIHLLINFNIQAKQKFYMLVDDIKTMPARGLRKIWQMWVNSVRHHLLRPISTVESFPNNKIVWNAYFLPIYVKYINVSTYNPET